MSKSRKIVTFYSYKGGVGRSQLCANVAAYFCFHLKKKVLLWDWDFEAPGLHFYFGKKDEDITTPGTLEFFEEYCRKMRSSDEIGLDALEYMPHNNILNLAESQRGGKIDLIPAGVYSNRFSQRANDFSWFQFYNILDGVTYIQELKRRLKEESEYDFIFIDSRTGISDYSGICNVQLPDINVILMAPNNQNFQGCKKIIEKLKDSEYVRRGFRELYILPILSRLDRSHPKFNKWIEDFTKLFSDLLPDLDNHIDTDFVQEIFADVYLQETFLQYVQKISAGENVFFNDTNQRIAKISFEQQYVGIGNYINKLSHDRSINISTQIDSATWLSYAENNARKLENNTDSEAEKHDLKAKIAKAYSYAEEYDKALEYGGTQKASFENAKNHFIIGDFDEALKHFKQAASYRNDTNLSGSAYFSIALIEQYKGNYNAAIQNYKESEANNSMKHWALNNAALCYFILGDVVKSVELLNKARKIKDNYIINRNLTEIKFNQQTDSTDKDNNGYKNFQILIQKFKKETAVWDNPGRLFVEKNLSLFDKELSISLSSYFKEENPVNRFFGTSHLYISKILSVPQVDENNDGNEISLKTQSSRDDEDFFSPFAETFYYDFWYSLSNLFLAEGRTKLSRKCLAKAKEEKIKEERFYGRTAFDGDNTKGETGEENYIPLTESGLHTAFKIGVTYQQKGEHEQADLYLAQVIDISNKITPKDKIKTDETVADAYFLLGNVSKAIETYKYAIEQAEASELKNQSAVLYSKLSDAYSQESDFSSAKASMEEALRIETQNPEYLNKYAITQELAGDLHTAIDYYSKALLQEPLNSVYLNNLGFAFFKLKKFNEAKNHIIKALEISPFFPDALINYGHLLTTEGDPVKARQSYILAKKHYHDDNMFEDIIKADAQLFNHYTGDVKSNYKKIISELLN